MRWHDVGALAACSEPAISCTADLKIIPISRATLVGNSSTLPEAEQGLVACGPSAARASQPRVVIQPFGLYLSVH